MAAAAASGDYRPLEGSRSLGAGTSAARLALAADWYTVWTETYLMGTPLSRSSILGGPEAQASPGTGCGCSVEMHPRQDLRVGGLCQHGFRALCGAGPESPMAALVDSDAVEAGVLVPGDGQSSSAVPLSG